MIDRLHEWINGIGDFIISLNMWIKIAAAAVIVLAVLIIITTIIKRKKARRAAALKLRKMEELNTAISNEKKGTKA